VFFVTVTCPCSSTTKCHVNLFVYNNNNNNLLLSGTGNCDWRSTHLVYNVKDWVTCRR